MTVFANVCGQDVHWSLTGSFHAVVTTDAVAGDVDVVEVCRCPGDGRVAVVAIVAARDVIGRFASRDCAVMARAAAPQYLRVIHAIHWLPHLGVVAIGTVVRGRYVRSRFAHRQHAIVAIDTRSQHLRVIYPEKR